MIRKIIDTLSDQDPLRKVEIAFGVWSVLYLIETVIDLQQHEESPELSALTGALGGSNISGFNTSQISTFTNNASIAEVALVIGCGWIMVRFLATAQKWAYSLFLSSCYFSLLDNLFSLCMPGDHPVRTRLLAAAYFALTSIMIRNAWIARSEEVG